MYGFRQNEPRALKHVGRRKTRQLQRLLLLLLLLLLPL
jgi:hypothetical protein